VELLHIAGDARVAPVTQQLISDVLRRAEKLHGAKPAVVDGDTRFSYAELAMRCRRLAGGLRSLGVGRGDRVAVLMANGHRYLEALVSIPGMGAVIVPLNNRLAVPEHRYILEDAGVLVLLVDELNAEVGAQLAGSVKEVVVAPIGYEALLTDGPEVTVSRDEIDENELAGLFYTGGTTGAAKGVMLSHRNLLANAMHITVALRYRDSDVYLHCAPMFHLADGASTYSVTWVGGTHVFVPTFEPASVLRVIETEAVTNTLMVPTMLSAVNAHPDAATTDLSSMRLVLHGAAPIATELLRESIRTFGCSFAQGYGMTEAAPLLTVLTEEERLVDDERLRSAGREIVGVEVTVRREDGTPCEVGEVGEVVARGPNFMAGYWNKPEETQAALRDGWYWSQDLGYLDDDGYLFLVDRAKDMIISGGENVYSIEVEDALMSHPGVLECAVIGVPDDKWGERVHAAIVCKPGQSVEADELVAHCKERIAGFKTPRSIEFLDELPRSGAGKILKKDIRDRHWSSEGRRIH
jgi:long-chain acyl-CoA synthetase